MEQAMTSYRHGRPALRAAAIGLGVFSIGLGLAELLAPRRMARATGLAGREGLLQAYGVREIATGIGLLAADNPAPWLWARVAGDALDVSTLAAAATGGKPRSSHALASLLAVSPIGFLDIATALLAQSRVNARANAAWDYSDRSGYWGRSPDQVRGAATDAPRPAEATSAAPVQALEATA